jgi:hypothetical protein
VAVALTDTADKRLRRGAVGIGALADGDVGRQAVEIGEAHGVVLVELLGIEGSDGDRGCFQALLAELRGDHDFLQKRGSLWWRAGGTGGLIGQRSAGADAQCQADRNGAPATGAAPWAPQGVPDELVDRGGGFVGPGDRLHERILLTLRWH